MAVAVASTANTAWTGCSNGVGITITKPTGLAVGDLMIAHIGSTSNNNDTHTISLPSGWTSLESETIGDGNASVATITSYIVATSTETAASDFTFTNTSGGNRFIAGAIYRITGQGDVVHLQSAEDSESSTTSSPVFTNTVTPSFSDSLLLFLTTAVDSENSGSTSTYAITTSNPSWTEHYDIYGDSTAFLGAGNGDGLMAGASAVRPEVTATGNSSCVYTDFAYKSIGTILVIPPISNATVAAPDPAVLTISAPDFTATGTAVVTAPDPAVFTITANEVTATVTTSDWNNQDKNSVTFTNTPKS